jgi:gas vesicle protein
MANTAKTIATLLIGAAIGAAVGYVLATDEDKRQEDMDKIKDRISDLKDRFKKKTEDLEQEIYNG